MTGSFGRVCGQNKTSRRLEVRLSHPVPSRRLPCVLLLTEHFQFPASNIKSLLFGTGGSCRIKVYIYMIYPQKTNMTMWTKTTSWKLKINFLLQNCDFPLPWSVYRRLITHQPCFLTSPFLHPKSGHWDILSLDSLCWIHIWRPFGRMGEGLPTCLELLAIKQGVIGGIFLTPGSTTPFVSRCDGAKSPWALHGQIGETSGSGQECHHGHHVQKNTNYNYSKPHNFYPTKIRESHKITVIKITHNFFIPQVPGGNQSIVHNPLLTLH